MTWKPTRFQKKTFELLHDAGAIREEFMRAPAMKALRAYKAKFGPVAANALIRIYGLAQIGISEFKEPLRGSAALLDALAVIHAEATDRQDTTLPKILDRIKRVSAKAIKEAEAGR